MTTAKKMREISNKAAEKAKKEAVEAEKARKEYRKTLVRRAEELFPEILKKVLKEIEEDAGAGYAAYTMAVFEYNYGEHEFLAYEMVAKELATKKYGYRVKGPSRRDGYDGDGDNSHDYYTVHQWEISW